MADTRGTHGSSHRPNLYVVQGARQALGRGRKSLDIDVRCRNLSKMRETVAEQLSLKGIRNRFTHLLRQSRTLRTT